ncbi:2-amino-4-hydroxy-6-hydroxymethyldihydropteridine diphosphokinase [Candidatus Methylomicrobium oryzae]|jgi:2-amino-4-hydroxy-6-hydroxymethyldihydropteridine diphosphokinase|uniref:2-amino-4-hydroxy-6- hydroxymethyldihydropteridine diphosphokinase n=1 Tax=Candidatus Methylomicrobium oryzae TaxID=2802053 RepID=UPI0019237A9A|nr:2-amino-4-hydroxy-6-hydroxymethyldihydropteridine diphosphokinase [Methylomicrobium sp. RS1]MBL1263290.1 2-amino-4-hydroxy-6-hydroxymethyldihydropteridine diphosphokinase [Methylomicrobium sp. RS1]
MNKPNNGTVTAYIGLGSNLADPVEQVRSARAECAAVPGVRELAFSSLYRSPPMGPQDQPDYVNAVMAVSTDLAAPALLHHLQHIEQVHGRVRVGERWTARTLDLDLLIYGEHRIETAELTVPHPGLSLRAFVLYPLFEIAPELVAPGLGRIADLIVNCPRGGLERIN